MQSWQKRIRSGLEVSGLSDMVLFQMRPFDGCLAPLEIFMLTWPFLPLSVETEPAQPSIPGRGTGGGKGGVDDVFYCVCVVVVMNAVKQRAEFEKQSSHVQR